MDLYRGNRDEEFHRLGEGTIECTRHGSLQPGDHDVLPPLHDVVDHYRRAGVLVAVNGDQPVELVTDALLERLVAGGERG